MIGTCGTREVRLMARVAGRRRVHIVVVGMTLNARQCRVHAGKWIVCIRRVVEIHGSPIRRRMAGIARRWKSRSGVARIRGSFPVRLVTAKAGRRQCRVVVVCMALAARYRRMGACKRKHRAVIETRWAPGAGCVTEPAVGWESCRDVTRIRGARKLGLMASIARRGKRCVIVVHVALRARNRRMRARQWERRVVVVEARESPRRCVVALCAIRRKTRRHVGRIVSAVEVCLVASIAVGWQSCVVIVRVALHACHRRMCSR